MNVDASCILNKCLVYFHVFASMTCRNQPHDHRGGRVVHDVEGGHGETQGKCCRACMQEWRRGDSGREPSPGES